MKRTFLLTYITASGKTYTEFKTFENGIDKDKCVRRILDEFDELPYLYLEKGNSIHYINVDHIESLEIEEVHDGQSITYSS
ncbi:hypothetical protein WL766_09935 [Staphylococcus pasteuri]|uniref:hypothetical protein n=1 Tax=Staphylococcus TaxID=1279 RepID=UPI0008A3FF35|nr:MULTISPECIES: hypothetical protein [Staphylococcus]MCO0861755.1 hypothetical protein [Staphylococcus pasteuri]MCO5359804.1 hypothetical protein [Staphylococcus pasteuri]OFV11372.1 hypothetical protein HMPREF3125_03240 [Staphylococcus sp. HMSC13A10]QDW85487.1 hypothetical protein DWB95_11425 [Staphylococcus pasteuri]UXR67324.1 hypothetical protein MUA61_11635 [Staphylococcus pasteuri]